MGTSAIERSWLLDHIAPPGAPRDATQVQQNVYKNDRTVGPATRGNLPLPQAEAPESRESWLMGHISDMLPVLGAGRAVGAGHEMAQSGHPALGAAMAGLGLIPEFGGPLAKGLARLVGGAAEHELPAAVKGATHVFDHYSNADLSKGVLDPAFQGTGLAGAERARVNRIPMMHVYDAGAAPERQFSRMPKYNVHVNGSIYDVGADPDGIAAGIQKKVAAGKLAGTPGDALEKAIQKAGHAGYYNSETYPQIKKLFGTHPVTPDGVPYTPAGVDATAAGIAPPTPTVAPKGNPEVMGVLKRFQDQSGAPNMPRVTAVDPERARYMAGVYESLPKHDPKARASYDALNREVEAQHQAILDAGHRIEYVDQDPYKTSKEMMADVRDNKTLKVFKTPRPTGAISAAAIRLPDGSVHEGVSHWPAIEAAIAAGKLPQPEHPEFEKMLQQSEDGFTDDGGNFLSREQAAKRFDFPNGFPARYFTSEEAAGAQGGFAPKVQFHPYMTPEQNDKFRAVHDWLAHAGEGHSFGPIGEENAYRVHASTLSPEARQALATETRGQNSWVNFGPNAHLPVAERPFAEQKAALWPSHLTGDYGEMDAPTPWAPGQVSSVARGNPALARGDMFDRLQGTADTAVGKLQTQAPPSPIAGESGAKGAWDVPKPVFPPQTDLRRFVGKRINPQRVDDVQQEALKTYTSPQFEHWLRGGNFGNWYDTRGTQQKAVDALGSDEGNAGFRRLMEMMGATTARSDPGNNLRRAGYYRSLEQAGLLDADALRAGGYKGVPEGMGHLANNAHHAGLARLLEEGEINPEVNPKPAAFVQNLMRNFRPYTNDTRMATGAAHANPRLLDLGAIVKSVTQQEGKAPATAFSPRDWAYAPMERAAQEAAQIHAGRGLLDVPAGADPTAFWQAKIWDGLSSHIPGASPSQGIFDDVFNAKLHANAKAWGVTPEQANHLYWQGHPFDLPLKTDLVPRGLLDRF